MFFLDMGTTNARLSLNGVTKKKPLGVSYARENGVPALRREMQSWVADLLAAQNIGQTPTLWCAGMVGSELGLAPVPHLPLPVNAVQLAQGLTFTTPESMTVPLAVVPGLKMQDAEGCTIDVIRGEETEVFGILAQKPLTRDVLLLLPGSHNKLISVRADGTITDFRSTLSGEIFAALAKNTILASSVSMDAPLDPAALRRGAEACRKDGLNTAVFRVRAMALSGSAAETERTSFLLGAVLQTEIALIRQEAGGRPVWIGGQKRLKEAYAVLLESLEPVVLPDETCENAMTEGLALIARLRERLASVETAKKRLAETRLIAILRGVHGQALLDTAQALYDGGIRLLELPFDRSGKFPAEQTAEEIAALRKKFGGALSVGAGTVCREKQLLLAFAAGADYIISPNTDEAIIRRTKALGLLSMPGAMTPGEAAQAADAGADYIKLFPVGVMGAGYVRDLAAPLSDVKFLAVGGVNAENLSAFLNAGCVGAGVASSLTDRDAIARGDWEKLRRTAEQFIRAASLCHTV